MSDLRVEKLIIKEFKRIGGIEIDLKPVTALVGGNTSGKSSVLQAAQLCVAMIQTSFQKLKKNGDAEYLTTLSNESVSYRPTEYLLDLRHGEPATQKSGFEIGFECTERGADGSEVRKSLSLGVVRGKNANLALSYTGATSLISVLGDRDRPFSIFAPGLSGIPLREEWRTRGVLDAAAMHGDANLYLRTLLDHLLHKDLTDDLVKAWCDGGIDIHGLPESAPWRTFSSLLDRCYPGARVFVDHDREKDRFINVRVWYDNQYAALDMASTGMLQVIQILAYACFYNPPLLLLDEPDAHLHADSQARLYEALRGLAEGVGTRIVFATHSPQLIQLMLGDEKASVVWMDRGGKVEVGPEGRPAIPLLMELGALTVGAEVFSQANKTILLTEDKDADPVKVFARANGAKNFACLSYSGCGNLGGARHLARLLCELRPEARIFIHRDRDFRTAEEMAFEKAVFDKWCQQEGVDRIVELFTPFNDVEHSFVQPKHLFEVLSNELGKERVEAILADVIMTERDEITAKIRAARDVIGNNLYESERMKRKANLRAESGIPDKAPKTKGFLPANGAVPLEVEQCHGKTVFRALTAVLHKELGGDSKAIPGKVLKVSKHLLVADWRAAFKAPVTA